MGHTDVGWLLFLIGDASSDGASRVRVWRALRALGPAILRDGVYVLPARPDLERALRTQALEVKRGGGRAFVFPLHPSADDEPVLRGLFDRSGDFATLIEALQRFVHSECSTRGEAEARRALRALQREFTALAATDYFPNAAHDAAKIAVNQCETVFQERFSPGEPHAAERAIPRLDRGEFQNRLWATRERLWVDRVASAWLIRTFIDPGATFRWFRDAHECPAEAVGFDFDGATFTHVGKSITFEVLLQSFGLNDDSGLARLGEMVRSLDVNDVPRSAEAAGFEALLTGAREKCATDDDLLAAISPPLSFLHVAFGHRANSAVGGDPEDSDSGVPG